MAKKKTAVVKGKKPVDLAKLDYGEDSGAGYEGQTREDIAMPFLTVLQPLSPAVVDKTVKGAKPGLLMNTVTEELMETVTFVPSCTRHEYVEWVPRKQGGGFVDKHDIHSPVVAKAKGEAEKFNKLKTPEGNDLVETFSVFGVLTDGPEVLGFVTLACTSTMIKVYKRFNTRLQTFMLKREGKPALKPPIFAHHCKVTVTAEKNAAGSWFNMAFSSAGDDLMTSLMEPADPRYQAAAECRDLVTEGVANPDYSSASRDERGEGEDDTIF